MQLTEKRLAANRANAKKSTGPRTPEGKRRSSQNALEHGVLAQAILIEGECEEGFLNLCKAYDREYSPQSLESAHMERHRHAIRDLLRIREKNMNLNKRTHFDEAIKELTAPDPIRNPFLTHRKPPESHLKGM